MGRSKVNKYSIPTGTQEERIVSMLKLLELQGAALSFKPIKKNAQKSHATLYDYLESVLEKEIDYREENRVWRWTQKAKFPFRKTTADFEFPFQPSIQQEIINELLSCRFVEQGENIVFLGQTGVGKSHLSYAIGIEAINCGYETRCLNLKDLIDLIEKLDGIQAQKLLRNLLLPKLLILEDMDYYDTGKNAGTFLFKLVTARYDNHLSIILSSNKKFSAWETLFGDQGRTTAALDRILERATIINITGPSYRLKDKLKEIESLKRETNSR